MLTNGSWSGEPRRVGRNLQLIQEGPGRHAANRRQFLWQVTAILGGTPGLADVWAASAPPHRKMASEDVVETVANGDLPFFAKQSSPKLAEGYRP